LCPQPWPAAQARPMCGEGEIESLCTAARLGLRSPCQQRRAPRVLARAPLGRASVWNRVTLTRALNRGCAAPPQGTISATLARQLLRPGSRRTRRSRRSTSEVRKRLGWLRRMEGSGDAWAHGRGPPRRRAQCAGRESESAFARSRASGCARPASSVGPRAFSCELHLRVLRLGIVWR
jgi:hypothetical protein